MRLSASPTHPPLPLPPAVTRTTHAACPSRASLTPPARRREQDQRGEAACQQFENKALIKTEVRSSFNHLTARQILGVIWDLSLSLSLSLSHSLS
mmetsp:Transcript_36276/g.85089  ORF Transcript_36276/g.85089 Transcript_36276/m.85089 type:complete len:95 (+) Transcript_36276:369-653(+)